MSVLARLKGISEINIKGIFKNTTKGSLQIFFLLKNGEKMIPVCLGLKATIEGKNSIACSDSRLLKNRLKATIEGNFTLFVLSKIFSSSPV
jgi:hypothetical protein